MTEPALSELLVVEVGRQVAVRYCGLLFRRLGATVLVVEPPGSDEPSSDLNAGKESMTLDLARPEGGALLGRLAEQADVLVADDSLPAELDCARLSRRNPRLIVTCISGAPLDDAAQRFVGLNAFTATLLPLITMSVLGRGQRIEVDGAECLAAAAMLVGDGQVPLETREPAAGELPFTVEGVVPPEPVSPAGRHNDEIYCELLGLTGDELARLRREAIV
ncbi:MAG: CoA transferase [Dehalococcoidia bacterium]|jgi:crotonobetainyl-CoA:carnitine CoA-transferase CaiB-like acyl-CoA transferase